MTIDNQATSTTPQFVPPFWLKNGNIQTCLASLGPRIFLARRRGRTMLAAAKEIVLDCKDGVRLLARVSIVPNTRPGKRRLVILLHGWEGSSDSGYILSAAAELFTHGFSVVRLNLRDHGPSHHLNRELFTSTRLAEVRNAIREILSLYPHDLSNLAGFSLGGNFVLRLASQLEPSELHRCCAICPLIDPDETTRKLQQQHPVYHAYFVRKWCRSLRRKASFFPDLGIEEMIRGRRTLSQLHDAFVPHHTPFSSTKEYFGAYRLTHQWIDAVRIPSHIIMAEDDPVISASHFSGLRTNPLVTVESLRYGGHCGFFQSSTLSSWVDGRLCSLFDE